MKLADIIGNKNLLHLERHVNEIRHSSTADYTEVGKAYHPRHGEMSFMLPVFSIDKQDANIYTARPSREARRFIQDKGRVRFFCHPESVGDFVGEEFRSPVSYLRVAPTSSTRTVYVFRAPELMLKTHLGKRISHFIRRLKGNSVRHSVQISGECERMSREKDCPKEFAYLPESVGVVHQSSDLGYLVREMQPRPHMSDRTLVPFFALYSHDSRSPQDPPLLCQLIARGPLPPLQYFERYILRPFIKTWSYAFLARGLLFESHGQNTLLELDETFVPRRIVQRDFQSVPIDPTIRARRGLPTPFQKHVIGRGDYPRLIEHSLQWDRFIGHCMFRSFAQFFRQEYGIPEEDFYALVRKTFRRYIPARTEKEFFPQGYVMLGAATEGDNTCTLEYFSAPPPCRPSYGLKRENMSKSSTKYLVSHAHKRHAVSGC